MKLLRNGPITVSFSIYFRILTCHILNLNQKMRRLCAWDSNPGLKAQMNPLSYSGTPTLKLLNTWCHRGGNANIWAILSLWPKFCLLNIVEKCQFSLLNRTLSSFAVLQQPIFHFCWNFFCVVDGMTMTTIEGELDGALNLYWAKLNCRQWE